MNKKFTKLLAAFALLCLFSTPAVGWGQNTYTIGWGTATGTAGTYTNFTETSGSVSGILSFSTAKNGSSSAPAYNSNNSELRLYYHSGGNGGSITITPATGITITGAVMTTSTSPSVTYTVDSGTAISVSVSNNTYTVSGISATQSLTFQNVNTTNTQLRIKTIALTYSTGGGSSTYTVTYNGNGNTSGDEPVDNNEYDEENNTVTVLGNTGNLAKTGHTFNGWNTAANGSGTSYAAGDQFTISANTTLYAQWILNTHNYTLTVSGGDHLTESVEISVPGQEGWNTGDAIQYGQQVTVSVIPSSGYSYSITVTEGNNNVPVNQDMFTMPDNDVTIAVNVFETPTYTVTFHAGTGSCATASFTEEVGTPVTLPTAAPSAACNTNGWTFAGWSTENVATATTTAPTFESSSYTINGNADLYAVYSVTEGDGGTTTFNFSDIATANNWQNSEAYTEVTIAPVTINAQGGGNNGKWYTTGGGSWRMYSGGTVMITVASNNVTAVTSSPLCDFTFNNGTASYSPSARTDFTQIEVTYGSSVTTYATSPSCSTLYEVEIDNLQHGAIVATPSHAEAGEEVTLTITPANCYQLKPNTLVVLDDEYEEVTVTDNKFTMPGSHVLVSAEFEAITYTVQYSVNGTIETALNETVNCGSGASLWDEEYLELAEVELPEGYTFAGWSTSESNNTVVSSYTPEANATLYAVLSITETGTPVTVYQKVTEAPSDWSGDYLIVAETQGKVFNGTAANNWGGCDDVEITDGTIEVTAAIDALVVTINAVTGGYQIEVGDQYMDWTAAKTFSLGETAETYSIELYNTTGNNDNIKILNNDIWLQYNASGGLRSYNSNQTPIQLYKKTTITPTTEHNYTLVKDVTGTETMANVEASHLITVKNGGVLNLTGTNNGTAANLIIEDGGQLVTSNAVAATVQKTIEAHGATVADGGWNFIATPIVNGTTPSTTNGILSSTEDDYDLFFYDEPTHYWRNYKNNDGNTNHGFALRNGQGYLYANAVTTTLSFTGTLRPSNAEYTVNSLSYTSGVGNLAGWNLVGNPFACNATVDRACYIIQDGVIVATNGTVAAPCSGVMVQATATEQTVTFTPTTNAAVFSTGHNQLNVTIANNMTARGEGSMIDNAIVSFNENSQLEKFVFFEDNAKLYIPQGEKDYAIVSAEAQGEMPVCFKATKDGEYTITVSPEGVELNYIHLIDNMTGMDVDLLQTPSYTFEASTRDYENRFRLVFAGASTDSATDESFAYYDGSEWKVSNEGEATLQVVDVIGRIVKSETINGNFSLNLNQKAGVYMLRLVNGENVKVQKVVVR